MATYYVRSLAGGGATGTDWANAFTTLATALSGKAAGDVFYISEDHAESTAGSVSLTSPGTASNPCFFYCANHSGSVPPVSADLRTTATVSTTGANGITLSAGVAYWYGVTFKSGSAANTASITIANNASTEMRFDSCGFTLNNTSVSSVITITTGNGTVGIRLFFLNPTFTFGSTSQKITTGNAVASVGISGGTLAGSVPTTLWTAAPSNGLDIIGMDLSALGAGKTLIGASGSSGRVRLQKCKLNALLGTVAATPTTLNQEVYLICTDSAGNYRHEKYHYTGTQTIETTIVRTGGATDGTTPIAWKIVTTANSLWTFPYESLPIAIWNDTSGSSVTATVCGIWGGGAVPNADDIWIDVEYLGTSGNPLASFINDSKADNLAAGSALASDSSTWGGSTTKFKMSVTFTPQQKGPIALVVRAAKASTTFYVDPLAVLT